MAVTNTPIYPQTIKNYVVQILPADTTTNKVIATGATNGTRLTSVNISSTDTANRDVSIYLTVSGTSYLLTTIRLTAGVGNGVTTASIDLLRNAQLPSLGWDANGNKEFILQSGATLDIACTTTVTAAKAIAVVAQGGDF